MPKYYRSQRMVLRDGGMRDVERIVAELGGRLVEDTGDQPPAPENPWRPTRIRTWELTPGVFLQQVEDFYARSVAAVVAGLELDVATNFSELVAGYLEPVPDEVLLAAAAHAETEEELAHAILRVGFGAPHEFDERFFAAVKTALGDPRHTVRAAGVRATMYSFWPEYRDCLRRLAAVEPDADLRDEAAFLAEAPINQYGQPLAGES